MEHNVIQGDARERCEMLPRQVRAFIDERRHAISVLSNAAALIYEALGDVNWAGFYLLHDGALLLGPFVGRPACVDIAPGKGVCGTALQRGETLVVPDVHKFPGHIACDSASNSEIVVPLRSAGRIVGVLDVDSPLLNRFGSVERAALEGAAEALGELDFASCGYNTGL